MAGAARANFKKAGLSDRIEVIVGDALEVLPRLEGKLDMVFLDAVKEDYLAYLKSVERLLHRGSVVVADNVKSHAAEIGPYLEYVRKSGGYSSTYREAPPNWGTDAGDAVEISVRLCTPSRSAASFRRRRRGGRASPCPGGHRTFP